MAIAKKVAYNKEEEFAPVKIIMHAPENLLHAPPSSPGSRPGSATQP